MKSEKQNHKSLNGILTAKTRNGMTSIMINVDFTPKALKKPAEPRTERMTMKTPARPSETCVRKKQSKDMIMMSVHKKINAIVNKKKINLVSRKHY